MKTILLLLLLAPSLFAQVSGLPSPAATSSTLGSVQPDNTSITVSSAGVLSAVSTPAAQYIAPQAISGCGVEYVGGLTYTIGACAYSINGIVYHSALTNITLSAADPTNPRIDVIFVDTTQVVQKITGTPAATPQQPVVDPSTQLQLTFVLVPATGTTPSNTTTVAIYQEGTEWTGSTGGTNSARVNLTSTTNPYLGTHDTEFGVGGTVATTTFAQYLDPAAGTVNMSNYNALVFYVRNKAAWASTRSVTVQWYNGATPTGIAVVLSNGAFGFNATTNISGYQQVSIPVSTFGIPGVPVTSLRFTVSGSGTALTGFYLDQVSLQGGNGSIVLPTTLMNFKGSWSGSSTYSPNDTVVNGGIGYVALATNTNVVVTTTATWAPLASGSVGTAGQLQKVGGTAGSFAASAATDSGTAFTISEPVAVNDGTGKAGNIGLVAGTAPSAAPANTVQINAPTAVTAYAINLPGAQPTAGNTRLDCTAANPAVCSWASAGSGITALTGDVTATGPGSAAATLASTAVTPGSYTNTNLTVDAKGRITAAANGSAAACGTCVITNPGVTQAITGTVNSITPLQVIKAGTIGDTGDYFDVGDSAGASDALKIDRNRNFVFGGSSYTFINGLLSIDNGGPGFAEIVAQGLQLKSTVIDMNLTVAGNSINMNIPSNQTLNLQTQQNTVNCATSGSIVWTQTFGGTPYKQIIIYANACVGTATFNFNVNFAHTPQILSQSLTSIVSAISTSSATITGTTSTGFLELDGF